MRNFFLAAYLAAVAVRGSSRDSSEELSEELSSDLQLCEGCVSNSSNGESSDDDDLIETDQIPDAPLARTSLVRPHGAPDEGPAALVQVHGILDTLASGGKSMLTSNFRGNAGNLASTVLQAIAPGTCLASSLNTGYTYPGEDDYPFMPACAGKGVSNTISCLPGDALIATPAGPLPVSELQERDLVATGVDRWGSLEFSPVEYFLHRLPAATSDYVQLDLEDGGQLVASLDHLVEVCGKGKSCGLRAAREISAGDQLVKADGKRVAVAGHQLLLGAERGLYAPVAPSSRSAKLLVDGVWVSEFSRIPLLSPGLDGATHRLARHITRTLSSVPKSLILSVAAPMASVVQRVISVTQKIV